MINKPFRIDELHKCNGMISMLITRVIISYYDENCSFYIS